MRDLPEVLFIVLQSNNSIEFYTTRVLSNGPFNTELVPISPPNYFPDKFESLDGIPVRFHTVMYPPYSYYERTTVEKANAWSRLPDGTDVVPMFIDGQESLILVEFCRKHNCTVEVLYDDDMWGEVFENQTGTGSLGAVAMHKADIALGAIYYCLDPYNFTTFTVSLSRSGLTVVVPKPGILAPWKTPFLLR
ncbi:uncharacterized protein LOC119768933 [Culex quinquefasciatus]|uniref:uncharacterized protein LOC119768933 n=1 Tax=Culex quinquefasciatus TaxID=7176 RepID=UPI0018E3753F|nr:uncharacterized protein LOC119768933 [Culex quinquefasciatus]